MALNEQRKLDNFFITIHNAYFQGKDMSNFSGKVPKPGELVSLLKDDNYVDTPLVIMLILMDMLGGLVSSKNGTKNHFYNFIEMYLKPLDEQYFTHKEILFYCRNLLVHNWIGATYVELSKGKGKRGNHLRYIKGVFYLNLDFLFRDLKNGFENLKSEIDKKPLLKTRVFFNLKRACFNKPPKP